MLGVRWNTCDPPPLSLMPFKPPLNLLHPLPTPPLVSLWVKYVTDFLYAHWLIGDFPFLSFPPFLLEKFTSYSAKAWPVTLILSQVKGLLSILSCIFKCVYVTFIVVFYVLLFCPVSFLMYFVSVWFNKMLLSHSNSLYTYPA